MVVDRAGAVAEAGIGRNGEGDISLGGFDGSPQVCAFGQLCCDGGRIGAARAVGVLSVDAPRLEPMELSLRIKQIIGLAAEVSPLHQNRLRPQLRDGLGGLSHGGRVRNGPAGEGAGFGQQRCTVLADHDRVDHEWEGEVRGAFGQRFNDFRGAEGAGFGCPRWQVFEHGIELREN